MLQPIIIIPALIAIWFIVRKSYVESFLYVYMTVVLMLPNWPRWIIGGLPDPSFHEITILPVAVAYLLDGRHTWRFSFIDIPVIFLLSIMGFSEVQNSGYADAQNLMFDMLAAGFLPYAMAKGIVAPHGMTVTFARRFVWCVALVMVAVLYEFKFAVNPYRLVMDIFFPGQGDGWITTFRYGFPRVSGSYSHPILAGVVFMIALHLQLWLVKVNGWELRFRSETFQRLKKPLALTFTTFSELVLTWCRGPQIGAIIAWICGWPGRGGNAKKRSRLLLAVLIFVGIPITVWFDSYVSVGRQMARTQAQETAAYRKELADKYIVIAKQHMWLGWGRNGYPKIPGMPSIDNYYLLLFLMHGIIAAGLLILIFIAMTIRLYRNAMKNISFLRPGSSLSFSLFGIYAGFAFSIATVYLGETLLPIFFMLTGFAEGYLVHGGDRTLIASDEVPDRPARKMAYDFQRVVA